MIKNYKNKVNVLASGGIDSTALVHFYITNGFQICLIYVDFKQLASNKEKRAIRKIAKYYEVDLQIIEVKGLSAKGSGFILGRNAMLIVLALTAMNNAKGIIATGIHAGTNYVDCTHEFLASTQDLVDLYTDGQVQIEAPFIEWTKRDIIEFCLRYNVPLKLTYSCENGLKQPCGKCVSCKDLEHYYKYVSKN